MFDNQVIQRTTCAALAISSMQNLRGLKSGGSGCRGLNVALLELVGVVEGVLAKEGEWVELDYLRYLVSGMRWVVGWFWIRGDGMCMPSQKGRRCE